MAWVSITVRVSLPLIALFYHIGYLRVHGYELGSCLPLVSSLSMRAPSPLGVGFSHQRHFFLSPIKRMSYGCSDANSLSCYW